MDIKIAVAAHKPYPMPRDDLYLPVQAGRAIHSPLDLIGDDTGETISEKNEAYCELTVLYWAWKNLDADCIGLCHYRRYFGWGKHRILTKAGARRLLGDAEVLLPKPRRYFIETNYSHYAHAHHGKDLDTARAVIGARFPEYSDAFDTVMKRTWGHRFNMMVMRRETLDRYCRWLFAVLGELEKRIDTSDYCDYDRRVMGLLGERLLDVWLEKERPRCCEISVVHLESQNWPRKIAAFLARKFTGEGSA